MKRTNMNYIRTDARKLVIFARVPVIFVRWRSQRTNMTGHCDARRRKNTAFSCVSGKIVIFATSAIREHFRPSGILAPRGAAE